MKKLTTLSLLSIFIFCPSTWAIEQNCDSPIIIDLNKNGIHLGNAGIGVYFDLLDTGTPVKLQWVKKNGDEAFLALDRNQNGIIDNGSELFGNGTLLILDNLKAPNGFVGLAQYDLPELGGNNDGVISIKDAIWSELSLWLDSNADGISTQDELMPLNYYDIESLATIPKVNNRSDSAGNWLPYWAWSYTNHSKDNKKRKMVDVFFKRLDE